MTRTGEGGGASTSKTAKKSSARSDWTKKEHCNDKQNSNRRDIGGTHAQRRKTGLATLRQTTSRLCGRRCARKHRPLWIEQKLRGHFPSRVNTFRPTKAQRKEAASNTTYKLSASQQAQGRVRPKHTHNTQGLPPRYVYSRDGVSYGEPLVHRNAVRHPVPRVQNHPRRAARRVQAQDRLFTPPPPHTRDTHLAKSGIEKKKARATERWR